MGGYVVYADILLALNFVLDLFLLWASGCFLRRERRFRRLIPAAACGAAYGGALVLPGPAWLFSLPVVVLVSLAMLAVAYPWRGVAAFLRLTAVFYLVAFAMAGSALAGAYLLDKGGYALDPLSTVKVGALAFGLFMGAVLARKGLASIRRNWRKEDFRARLEVRVGDKSCSFAALIDTGNDLHEPISGLPVLVVDYGSLIPLLPEGVRAAWERCNGDAVAMLARLEREEDPEGWAKRLRLVPFSSIGKNNGMMAGFRPDILLVEQRGQRLIGRGVVCIAAGGIAGGGEYQAVMNPDVAAYGESTGEASA